MDKIHGEIYLHVGNSGATFRVGDNEYGPVIEVFTSSHGNLRNTLEVMTDRESLVALGNMILEAAENVSGTRYVCPATMLDGEYRKKMLQDEAETK